MNNMDVIEYTVTKEKTEPLIDQHLNQNGLRKPVKRYQQKNYVENLMQSFINVICKSKDPLTLLVGGDGRYFSFECIEKIVKLCSACSKIREIIIAQNGMMSTPAMAYYIRKYKLTYGVILSAGCAKGGEEGFFGIKFNGSNGGPCSEQFNAKVSTAAASIESYNVCHDLVVDVKTPVEYNYKIKNGEKSHAVTIKIIDGLQDYVQLMRDTIEFKALRNLLRSGTRITVNAMNGVAGLYAKAILCQELGVLEYEAVKCEPLPDFGGTIPNPNAKCALDFVDLMSKGLHDVGAAIDAEGCRIFIMGKNNCIVQPSDFLAVLLSYCYQIQYFKKNEIVAIARTWTMSAALDRVAKELELPFHEISTKSKPLLNLFDSNNASVYADEEFKCLCILNRESDGLWTFLQLLLLMEIRRTTVQRLFRYHWNKYGRNFYVRLDYEDYELDALKEMMANIGKKIQDPNFIGLDLTSADLNLLTRKKYSRSDSVTALKETKEIKPTLKSPFEVASIEMFKYKDPCDGSLGPVEGYRIFATDGSRIAFRLVENDVEGNTFRVYIDKYIYDANAYEIDATVALEPLIRIAIELSQVRFHLKTIEPSSTY